MTKGDYCNGTCPCVRPSHVDTSTQEFHLGSGFILDFHVTMATDAISLDFYGLLDIHFQYK